MAKGIPYKGIVLTQISKFWFDILSASVEHHLITDELSEYPEPFCNYPEQLEGRSMLVQKGEVLPIECVIRGYLAGSGWKEYNKAKLYADSSFPKD